MKEAASTTVSSPVMDTPRRLSDPQQGVGVPGWPLSAYALCCRLPCHCRPLHNSRGDGPRYGIDAALVLADVVVVIDKAYFDDDGGHGRIAQDEESWPFLQPAVGQVEDGFDVGLNRMAQKQALCRMGDERFRAGGALVERVEVQGHEGVGLGVVGFTADGVQVSCCPNRTATPFRSKYPFTFWASS